MATVRFSKDLVTRITAGAHAKMLPPVNKAIEAKPDNSWGQRIYDTLFGDVQPILAQLPLGWVKEVKGLTVQRVGSETCDMEFTLAAPVKWPHILSDHPLARVSPSAYGEYINLLDNPVWGEFHAEVVAYNQRIAAAEQRQKEFVDMVEKVTEAYSTLAPALKAWPPLWELIPDDVKDKHREITVREKTEVKLDVDIGKLTAMSTAAKFGI